MLDDLTVLSGLSLKQLLDDDYTLCHDSFCTDREDNTLEKNKQKNNVDHQHMSCSSSVTVSVGKKQNQTVETGVCHLRDVGGTSANGLDCGCSKRLVLTFNIGLQGMGLRIKFKCKCKQFTETK